MSPVGQALFTFVYGAFVGTILVTGIAASTFLVNMSARVWDYLRLRGRAAKQ